MVSNPQSGKYSLRCSKFEDKNKGKKKAIHCELKTLVSNAKLIQILILAKFHAPIILGACP
jgi:isocitrate lyase